MKIKRKMFKFLSVALFAMLGSTVSTVANTQTLPCAPKVKGLHFTHPTYNYNSPVLLSNMPFDILLSYIILDSVLKYSDEAKDVVNSFLERFNSGQISYDNDTLNYAFKYMYSLSDYDPLIFFYNFLLRSGNKKIHPQYLFDDLVDCIEKTPNGEQKRRILRSPYILHIYVEETSMWIKDTSAPDAMCKDFTVVNAKVLDTIKGKTLPNINTLFLAKGLLDTTTDSGIPEAEETNAIPPKSNVNLIFDYCNQWGIDGRGRDWMILENGELCCYLKDKDGNPWIKPRREYIVLLAPNYECTYNGQFYYALWPVGGSYSHGMYPIENGTVMDEGNVWGWGETVPLETFKQNINTIINEIKNYGE